MRLSACVFIVIPLLGCSRAQRQDKSPSTGNVANDMLHDLNEQQQATHLAAVVEEGCVGTRAFYMGIDAQHSAFWGVGCENGQSYEVMIDNMLTEQRR